MTAQRPAPTGRQPAAEVVVATRAEPPDGPVPSAGEPTDAPGAVTPTAPPVSSVTPSTSKSASEFVADARAAERARAWRGWHRRDSERPGRRAGHADQGGRRRDRSEHGAQPAGADRHQLPRHPRQAARGQPQGDQRLPRAHRPGQGELHAPHRLRSRASDRRCRAGDAQQLRRGRRRQAAPRSPRRREHGPRRRRRRRRTAAVRWSCRSSGAPTR